MFGSHQLQASKIGRLGMLPEPASFARYQANMPLIKLGYGLWDRSEVLKPICDRKLSFTCETGPLGILRH
jgi:hypothetical protein